MPHSHLKTHIIHGEVNHMSTALYFSQINKCTITDRGKMTPLNRKKKWFIEMGRIVVRLFIPSWCLFLPTCQHLIGADQSWPLLK